MKTYSYLSFLLLLLTATSCEAIGDIFSAGFYTGLFVVLALAVGLIWLFGRRR